MNKESRLIIFLLVLIISYFVYEKVEKINMELVTRNQLLQKQTTIAEQQADLNSQAKCTERAEVFYKNLKLEYPMAYASALHKNYWNKRLAICFIQITNMTNIKVTTGEHTIIPTSMIYNVFTGERFRLMGNVISSTAEKDQQLDGCVVSTRSTDKTFQLMSCTTFSYSSMTNTTNFGSGFMDEEVLVEEEF